MADVTRVYRVTPYGQDWKQLKSYGSLVIIDCNTLQQALDRAAKYPHARINYCLIGVYEYHDLYTDQYYIDRGIWQAGGQQPSDWYPHGGWI